MASLSNTSSHGFRLASHRVEKAAKNLGTLETRWLISARQVSLITFMYMDGPLIDPLVRHQPNPAHSYPRSIRPVHPHMPDASSHQQSHSTVNHGIPATTCCTTLETLPLRHATLGDSLTQPLGTGREYLCSGKAEQTLASAHAGCWGAAGSNGHCLDTEEARVSGRAGPVLWRHPVWALKMGAGSFDTGSDRRWA